MTAKPIPHVYRTMFPYLIVNDAADAIEFYKQAFDAVELLRLVEPGGKIGHAEIKIGDSPIMLADEYPDLGYRSPQSLGGSTVSLGLYVEDVDAQFNQAIAAGAEVIEAVQDKFDGDRRGTLKDPFGHIWLIATRLEEVSPEEMQRRFDAVLG